jgi:hypothetical protein
VELYSFASVGVEPADMSAIKSVLKLVTGASGDWTVVDQPAQADITFVCGITPEQVVTMSQSLAGATVLVYCCGRGESPPDGVFVLRRPLRASEMTQIFDEAKVLHAARKNQAAPAPVEKPKARAEAAPKKKDDDDDGDLGDLAAWAG